MRKARLKQAVGLGDEIVFINRKPGIGTFQEKSGRGLGEPEGIGQRNTVKKGEKIMITVQTPAGDFEIKIKFGGAGKGKGFHEEILSLRAIAVPVLRTFDLLATIR